MESDKVIQRDDGLTMRAIQATAFQARVAGILPKFWPMPKGSLPRFFRQACPPPSLSWMRIRSPILVNCQLKNLTNSETNWNKAVIYFSLRICNHWSLYSRPDRSNLLIVYFIGKKLKFLSHLISASNIDTTWHRRSNCSAVLNNGNDTLTQSWKWQLSWHWAKWPILTTEKENSNIFCSRVMGQYSAIFFCGWSWWWWLRPTIFTSVKFQLLYYNCCDLFFY